VKILVVDDHALVREGLRQVLRGLDEALEVLDAPDCARAFDLAELHPDLDLVLLDYHLPDMNGLAALDIFAERHPELPIVILSGSASPQTMRRVMDRGAAGFVTKSGLSSELLSVVQLVMAGGIYVPPDCASESGPAPLQVSGAGGQAPALLTRRQELVLLELLDGRTNRQISAKLNLSEETVKNHVTAILRRFDVQTRTQAVLVAERHGYVAGGRSS
jgi:DNA-binding NarL/FixJ family response regulator